LAGAELLPEKFEDGALTDPLPEESVEPGGALSVAKKLGGPLRIGSTAGAGLLLAEGVGPRVSAGAVSISMSVMLSLTGVDAGAGAGSDADEAELLLAKDIWKLGTAGAGASFMSISGLLSMAVVDAGAGAPSDADGAGLLTKEDVDIGGRRRRRRELTLDRDKRKGISRTSRNGSRGSRGRKNIDLIWNNRETLEYLDQRIQYGGGENHVIVCVESGSGQKIRLDQIYTD
jgi:hypothetical protein